VTHVGADELGFRAECAQFGCEGSALFRPAAGDDDAGALVGEGEGSSASDACEGAGDQDNRSAHVTFPFNGG
jgi:hypothetical protein